MHALKEQHLNQLADYTRQLYRAPELRKLFLELTLQCNEHCWHCGSSCTAARGDELSTQEFCSVIDQVKIDFADKLPYLCITGGEPLLRHDFFDIMGHAHRLGFDWGMTSNGTLITPEVAHKLAACGMRTVSISIDGMPESHDRFRASSSGFDRAMAGVQSLIDEGAFSSVQVTTVVNHVTVNELDAMFDMLGDVDIDSWRVINVEPIGRALQRPDLMCTPDDLRRMFGFIREKRAQGWPVEYGCSHYLGLDFEVEVRPWYWLCNAGVYTASVMSNGDIAACLDIPRRPDTVQGNIRKRRLRDVWENEFALFRRDIGDSCEECCSCEHMRFCRGGACHSWDFDANRQQICLKGVLFD